MLSAWLMEISGTLMYFKNINCATIASGCLIDSHLNSTILESMSYCDVILFSIDPELTELESVKFYLFAKEASRYLLVSFISMLLISIKTLFVFTITSAILFCNSIFWSVVMLSSLTYHLLISILFELSDIIIGNQVAMASFLPLAWCFFMVSTLVSYVFYLFLGMSGFMAVTMMGALPFWLLSTFLFNYFFFLGNTLTLYMGDFNVMGVSNKVPLKFFFNKLTFGFGYLTLSIGVFVLIYSFFYFSGEPTKESLALLLLLFVNSMLILMFSDNLMVTFIGWEFMGVTSFFLINHWSSSSDTLKAALKALAYNLLSDAFLFVAFLGMLRTFGSLEISTIIMSVAEAFNKNEDVSHSVLSSLAYTSVFLILGGSIKSAQFFFHTWLPDSMEAPAPASALIHSATLVSAGMFLLARLTPMWAKSTMWLGLFTVEVKSFILIWGAITAAYGGLISAKQTDLKSMLAYSTISHCGYMMVLVGCECTDALLLYFYMHGLYKALLFLVTGNMMSVFQTQDFSKMGGAWHMVPLETITCMFGFMHLSGAPFSLGYVAKHQVMLLVPQKGLLGYFVMSLLILGACSSVFYSLEFMSCVFFEPDKSSKLGANTYHSKYFFTKYNNPTGKMGSLVIVTYFIFALLLGNMLSLTLMEKTTLEILKESLNLTTSKMKEVSKSTMGVESISTLVLMCYCVLLTLYVYLSSTNKIENNYPSVNYWMYNIMPVVVFFPFLYYLITTFMFYEPVWNFMTSLFSPEQLSYMAMEYDAAWIEESPDEFDDMEDSLSLKVWNLYAEALSYKEEVSSAKKKLVKLSSKKASLK